MTENQNTQRVGRSKNAKGVERSTMPSRQTKRGRPTTRDSRQESEENADNRTVKQRAKNGKGVERPVLPSRQKNSKEVEQPVLPASRQMKRGRPTRESRQESLEEFSEENLEEESSEESIDNEEFEEDVLNELGLTSVSQIQEPSQPLPWAPGGGGSRGHPC
ncbi:hypothetical protein M8J76_004304 [Diaphorina citri]|nr:hypothetical protein M8J76_004304 [Diaphorina citri]